MQIHKANQLIEEANLLLNSALHEMERSEEDVTTFMVCYNSRQSIVNYLSSFLIRNGIELQTPVTIHSLIEQCRDEDDRFQMVDVSQILCSHDNNDEAYCLHMDKVKECVEVAKMARDVSTSDSPSH